MPAAPVEWHPARMTHVAPIRIPRGSALMSEPSRPTSEEEHGRDAQRMHGPPSDRKIHIPSGIPYLTTIRRAVVAIVAAESFALPLWSHRPIDPRPELRANDPRRS